MLLQQHAVQPMSSMQSMKEGLGVDMTTRRVGKHRIYMNVGYDLTEEDLRQYFSTFGQVSDVYLPKHKSSRNKGFGFTTFETEKALEAALEVSSVATTLYVMQRVRLRWRSCCGLHSIASSQAAHHRDGR